MKKVVVIVMCALLSTLVLGCNERDAITAPFQETDDTNTPVTGITDTGVPSNSTSEYFRILIIPDEVKIGEPLEIVAESNYHHREMNERVYALEFEQYVWPEKNTELYMKYRPSEYIAYADDENIIRWYIDTEPFDDILGYLDVYFYLITYDEESDGGINENWKFMPLIERIKFTK